MPVKHARLFLGNAGTAFRPLTAVLAFAFGDYILSGVDRMHERPIGDLVDGLRQLGADVTYLGNDGYPPLQLKPAKIYPEGVVKVRGDVSSQFLTGLLMALPLTGETVTVEVIGELISKPYIEITLATMARFGVVVERDGWQRFTVKAGSRYVSPGTIYVEGDASSASYFLALGAIGGGPVRVEGVVVPVLPYRSSRSSSRRARAAVPVRVTSASKLPVTKALRAGMARVSSVIAGAGPA